jgi:hypothetical protein
MVVRQIWLLPGVLKQTLRQSPYWIGRLLAYPYAARCRLLRERRAGPRRKRHGEEGGDQWQPSLTRNHGLPFLLVLVEKWTDERRP